MLNKQGMEYGLGGAAGAGIRQIAPTIALVLTIAASVMLDRVPAIAVGNTNTINPSVTPSARDRDQTQANDRDSEPQTTPDPNPAQDPTEPSCPGEIDALARELLDDFPSYYNRALVRGRLPGESAGNSRVLLASDPEIFGAEDLAEFGSSAIEGFFFTTLERAYRDGKATQQQGFHQVFLTRDVIGWLVVTTRSGWGDYPAGDRMTPPLESNSGLVVQTIRTWLRDCEAR
ncbi:MAG: hypothetical protein EAZ61_12530 [Oscillatoriales cyanobacterium]|nr:MAG: hypothetical protein EAZ61_12530 [Oscillatoriales cyanobacterium]